MLKKIFILLNLSYVSCFVSISNLPVLTRNNINNKITMMQNPKLKETDFNLIDTDKSGSIDKTELLNYFGNNNLMNIADIDGENAIKFGLLNKNSILADGKASILVGNKGFDPLNCATDMSTLKKYREAEIKHGRLAMLASVGWPLSELYHPFLSRLSNNINLLSDNNKVPSLLNGGLEKINPIFFMAIIIFTATVESVALNRKNEDYIPGDLGFDPLKLYVNKDPYIKRDLELKELNNGRLAMLAITYYAFSEFVNNNAITNLTPFLFKSTL
jgi:hypothetical protein